jgi:3-deoxy-D-manno-octulosonate 8-phosphate phosphatase KdsC-like HAD superfamily phosphatase
MDVDGVMTDGTKTYDRAGNIIGKIINDRDITALLWLKDQGIRIVWISGCKFANESIAKARGFEFVFVREKITACAQLNIPPDKLCYIGDDNYDIPALKFADYSFCPADAPLPVREAAKVTCKTLSGRGVVAEVVWEYLYDKL